MFRPVVLIIFFSIISISSIIFFSLSYPNTASVVNKKNSESIIKENKNLDSKNIIEGKKVVALIPPKKYKIIQKENRLSEKSVVPTRKRPPQKEKLQIQENQKEMIKRLLREVMKKES